MKITVRELMRRERINVLNMIDVDEVAEIIRLVDGENKLGAGELAERILEELIKRS